MSEISFSELETLDFDGIEDLPWAKDLWKNIVAKNKKGFLHWCSIVKRLAGTSPKYVEGWITEYVQAIEETCCDLVINIQERETETCEKIKNLLARLQELCVILHIPMPQNLGADESLGLFADQNQLLTEINKHEKLIKEKQDQLEKLQKKQFKLCEELGAIVKYKFSCPPIPKPKQLRDIELYIEELEKESFDRHEKFLTLKEEILKNVDELKFKPTCEFERQLLSSNDFLISTAHMSKLEIFHKNLNDIKKSAVEEISQLRSRIEDLWGILDVDIKFQDEFRTTYTGISLETLEALRNEVKKCEEIRKANVKIFIDRLRQELENLWKKCHCTDVERRKFTWFKSELYNEDLLDLHEIEIRTWKKYYQENAKLLGALEKHTELWEKMIELENNATGVNRYKNRGGTLLQEEKERNKLLKILPKLEEEILALSEKYKTENGVSFKSFGRTPEEYISQMHDERENNRKQKLSARKMKRENILTPGKSAMNLFPSCSTIGSTTKRNLFLTPNHNNTKRLKLNTPRSAAAPKTRATPTLNPRTKITYTPMTLPRQRRSKSSTEHSKRLSKSHKKSPKTPKKRELDSDDSYAEFLNPLANSSVHPD